MRERELLRQALILVDHALSELKMGGDRAKLTRTLEAFCAEHELVIELMLNAPAASPATGQGR